MKETERYGNGAMRNRSGAKTERRREAPARGHLKECGAETRRERSQERELWLDGAEVKRGGLDMERRREVRARGHFGEYGAELYGAAEYEAE